jgi:hypothetical protein
MNTATTERRTVIPPAVQAARMQRYSLYLVILAFIIVGANYQALTMPSVLWFAAGITAAFSLLCAITVVILEAIAWNFDRLRSELALRPSAQSVAAPDTDSAPPASRHALTDTDAAGPDILIDG